MSAPMKIEEAWLEAIRAVDWAHGSQATREIYTAYLSAVAPLIRAAALEEAAQKAVFHEFRDDGEYADGYNDAVSDIAAGIRALATTGEPS